MQATNNANLDIYVSVDQTGGGAIQALVGSAVQIKDSAAQVQGGTLATGGKDVVEVSEWATPGCSKSGVVGRN